MPLFNVRIPSQAGIIRSIMIIPMKPKKSEFYIRSTERKILTAMSRMHGVPINELIQFIIVFTETYDREFGAWLGDQFGLQENIIPLDVNPDNRT